MITPRYMGKLIVLLVLMAAATPLAAQSDSAAAPAGTCRERPCRLVIDFGGGGSDALLVQDRRYGSIADFETTLRQTLVAKAFKVSESSSGGELVISIRPRMTRAMCDAMPGTNTDYSCRMMGEAEITFQGAAEGVNVPGNTRVRNRCGGSEVMMDMKQFSVYVGETIAYALANDRKAKRPSAKC